ncbi:alpha-amylase [Altererythrobacter luteolus]|uniref:Alpha-amylase n=1 Tax=Pontixanthobacter luteolus TaxID=295089 RepID=A0A6I4V148_9SPHN|nr:alpha-amylase [Pontixanthobacter luteolus]
MKRPLTAITALLPALLMGCQQISPSASAEEYRDRPPEDEVVYFVLPDRFANGDPTNDLGGLPDEKLVSGYDPTHKGFFHGGDLAGLTAKFDYLEEMGITAIWFAPIFKNKPVQGPEGGESAGYHGYWVTDFTSIDPHFGTNDEFKAFVDAAHARGMKVYMDIITNHTADVIRYKEGDETGYAYRHLGEYPYSTRGDVKGEQINEGFMGDQVMTEENFAKLTDPSYAYTPFVPEAEKDVKVPAWLNDPVYYHNRGDSYWEGESAVYGDFVGLDDLFTEHPRVVAGMIDIYGDWIDRFGIDGFRIDTAKHVNPEFWQRFVPAMLDRAKAKGIPNFHIFGEVATQTVDPALTARWTRIAGLPTNLDMAFAAASQGVVSGTLPPSAMARLLEDDPLYEGGAATGLRLPTFLGNHDFGRFSMFVKQANPDAGEEELLSRLMLGNAMLFGLRGVPVVYYGDEQGFVSDGNDQLARENMFPSQVSVYNDNKLIGTDATTAQDNFDTTHPLYRQIATLAAARKDNPALRHGMTRVLTADFEGPGLLAIARHDEKSGQRVVLAFNTSAEAITRTLAIDYAAAGISLIAGDCPAAIAAPGAVTMTLPAFGYVICRLDERAQ